MEHPADYDALLKICESRRSARVFDGRPLSADTLERIKRIARTSPYASARKKWDMITVTDRGLLKEMKAAVERRAGKIGAGLRPDMEGFFEEYSRNFTFFASAPAVIVLMFRSAPTLSLMLAEEDGSLLQWEKDNYVKSISCVAMLVLLAAESLGLGSCYVTGALIAEKEIGPLIGVPPGWSIGALLPIGYRPGEAL